MKLDVLHYFENFSLKHSWSALGFLDRIVYILKFYSEDITICDCASVVDIVTKGCETDMSPRICDFVVYREQCSYRDQNT